MTSCKNHPHYKITILDTSKTKNQCRDCFEEFQIMATGHEDRYSVEVLSN